MGQCLNEIRKEFAEAEDKIQFLKEIKDLVFELSPFNKMPIENVRWIPIEKVEANNYNPNSVARNELKLLYLSIKEDGYTQPVVTIYDEERDKYVIVDGFHRYLTMSQNKDIRDDNFGRLPCVVIDKNINQRMASTIRHNRARGKHSVAGMSGIVFDMLNNGWTDEQVCNEIGLEPDELLRLKHITGFSKLFDNVEYRRAWETKKQIIIKQKYYAEHPDEDPRQKDKH